MEGEQGVRWNGRADDPVQRDGPSQGEGMGRDGIQAPLPHAQVSKNPPLLVLHGPVLLLSDPTSPCKICGYGPDLRNLGTAIGMQYLPTGWGEPKEQVQFEVDEELGDEPDLPQNIAHFLAEGAAP